MHCPVLLEEIIGYLSLKRGDVVIDATLGGGGHSSEILKRILPNGKLIAVDRDKEAIKRNSIKFKEYEDNIIFVNEDFRNIDRIMEASGEKKVNGVVFDLGMSSFQVDDGERGFSFMKEGPLDMRYDPDKGLSAADIVNDFGKEEIEDIIRNYGEERHAKHLANIICSERRKSRIRTTKDLSDIIFKAVGSKYKRQRINPACRTFQGLRIFVNDELGAEEEALKGASRYLATGGRICVISFHSLEDRIAKNVFKDMAKREEVSIVTKKPIVPSRKEILENSRARSAKLRVVEKII